MSTVSQSKIVEIFKQHSTWLQDFISEVEIDPNEESSSNGDVGIPIASLINDLGQHIPELRNLFPTVVTLSAQLTKKLLRDFVQQQMRQACNVTLPDRLTTVPSGEFPQNHPFRRKVSGKLVRKLDQFFRLNNEIYEDEEDAEDDFDFNFDDEEEQESSPVELVPNHITPARTLIRLFASYENDSHMRVLPKGESYWVRGWSFRDSGMWKVGITRDQVNNILTTLQGLAEDELLEHKLKEYVGPRSYDIVDCVVKNDDIAKLDDVAMEIDSASTPGFSSYSLSYSDACKYARWGTYGIDGKQPLKRVLMCECTIDHLCAILKSQRINDMSFGLLCRMLIAQKIREAPAEQLLTSSWSWIRDFGLLKAGAVNDAPK